MSKEKLDRLISVRLTKSEERTLYTVARKSNMNISEYLRALVSLRKILRVVSWVEEEERHHCVVPLDQQEGIEI